VDIRSDDEIYRVDAVWLGPPRATFPWRASYSSYGLGALLLCLTLIVEHRLGFALGVFSIAWAGVLAVVTTRLLNKRINHERPATQLGRALITEMTTPRMDSAPQGGHPDPHTVRVRPSRPLPTSRRRRSR
jgi:hypothetical protein